MKYIFSLARLNQLVVISGTSLRTLPRMLHVVTMISLISHLGCGADKPTTPNSAPPATSSSSNATAPAANSTMTAEPIVNPQATAAMEKDRAMKASFKEFHAAMSETDPVKWNERYNASYEKVISFGPEIIPVLISSLQDTDEQVRESASILLAAIGPSSPETAQHLIPFLKDSSEMVRVNLVACLTLIPEQEPVAIEELKKLLQSTDDSIKSTAVACVGNLKKHAQPLIPQILEQLQHASPAIRMLVVQSLGEMEMEDPNIIAALEKITQSPEESAELKTAATDALSQIRSSNSSLTLPTPPDLSPSN